MPRATGWRHQRVHIPGRVLRTVVLTTLASAGWAQAQTVPYEAPQRYNIGTGPGQQGLPSGTVFEPRVDAALQYVANINLAEDGEPQIDMAGLEVAPGFYASHSSGKFVGVIDYSLIGRGWEESDYNDLAHRLAANGEWFAVPSWFSIRGEASYSDTVIDPAVSLNYGGLGIFGPGNLAEVATASLNPVIAHSFSQVQFIAQYGYGRVWYLDEGKGQPTFGFVSNRDSKDQFVNLSFGSREGAGRLSAQAYYDWQHSEFETAIPYDYERIGMSLEYLLGRGVKILGDYGRESDLTTSTTQGGLDSSFWSAGLRWVPNERTSMEARFGDRFFGNSYSFSLYHRARLLEFSASYREEPSVQTRELSLGDFDPGQLPPDSPGFDFGRLNGSPYVGRNGQATVATAGSRTRFTLMAFYFERDYLRALQEDDQEQGAAFLVTRQLASNLSTDFSIYYSEYDRSRPILEPIRVAESITDHDTRATVRLNRSTGATLTLTGEAGYLQRSNSYDYDGWWIALRVRWSPLSGSSGR